VNIEWSDEALADLASVHAFIAKENPSAAQRVVLSILASVENNLPDNQHIGRPGRVNGTRELVITHTPYIVLYRVKSGIIQVLRVYHGARRWPDQL
jgi:toxin ParE1/3/4